MNTNMNTNNGYFKAGENFDGFELRSKEEANRYYKNLDFLCPVCKGHGGWNIALNQYGQGKHFRAGCFQCSGWGYVNNADKDCVHNYREINAEESRKRGIAHYGNCWHNVMCNKCGRISGYDSSD